MDLLDPVDLLGLQEGLGRLEALDCLDHLDPVVPQDHLDLQVDLDRLVELDCPDHLDQVDPLVRQSLTDLNLLFHNKSQP